MSEFKHVVHDIQRVPDELVQAISPIPTATLHEAYGQKGALYADIRPVRLGMKLCGPVVTVKSSPGDNIIVHKAIYVTRPGDVLLVDTGGYIEGGFWGGIMTAAAIQQKIAGLVTDGSVRDTDEIDAMGFPVFSQGISIKGTGKNCLGMINHPIVFSGILVNPGDLIAADSDGVVVIARQDVPDVLEKARQREDKEKRGVKEIRNGRTTLDIYGFSAKLKQLGLTE
jgi:4-hydroxy-4-methyl-2-oxoglutarate aldolase